MSRYKYYCEYWSNKEKGLSSPILYVNGLQIIIQVEKLKMIQK